MYGAKAFLGLIVHIVYIWNQRKNTENKIKIHIITYLHMGAVARPPWSGGYAGLYGRAVENHWGRNP
jgi:hypothetical protein